MNLLFRTDASLKIGTGHVMRCLALAQAWQDAGGHSLFAMAEATPAIQARLAAESCQIFFLSSCTAGTVDDSLQTIALAREQQAGWIVVDGYQFDAGYQSALKAAGFSVLFLDDYGHAGHYSADLVLNQNAYANEALYADREPQARLLLGPRYCLLRRGFAAWRDWKREVSPVGHRLLVTVGGSDPANLTERIVQAVAAVEIEGLEARIVVGGSNPHFESLQHYTSQNAERITVWRSVSDMAELMAWADIAVSSAGTTSWELAFMQVPSVLLAVVEHQWPVAQALETSRAAVSLGRFSETDERKIAQAVRELLDDGRLRKEMAANGRGLVDGYGVDRVVSVLAKGKEASKA
jgi:UDP-2,4-diacetamido-2,4,6-trideoxy-beta-L-altropyranose hydrolase